MKMVNHFEKMVTKIHLTHVIKDAFLTASFTCSHRRERLLR